MATIQVEPLLDGKPLAKAGGDPVDVINPATGQVIARQMCCDTAAVNRIVESSHQAFVSETWQNMPPAERGRLLLKLADIVESEAENLVELELLDTGKPIGALRGGELPLSVALIRFYAGAADKIEGKVKEVQKV